MEEVRAELNSKGLINEEGEPGRANFGLYSCSMGTDMPSGSQGHACLGWDLRLVSHQGKEGPGVWQWAAGRWTQP